LLLQKSQYIIVHSGQDKTVMYTGALMETKKESDNGFDTHPILDQTTVKAINTVRSVGPRG
jgi:hypothetical protein